MSAWPGKYVIGLTGNIGTGKSEVRRMLEKLGAYGIDADALAHQVLLKGEPAFEAVIQEFGLEILGADGQIDRNRLGQVVFADPQALTKLEKLVHPQVRKIVDRQVRLAAQSIVVIEAIKLLESGYPSLCDEIWVADSQPTVQLERLMKLRGMSETQARQRIAAQADQAVKLAAADVIIGNNGSLEDTWQQVLANWQKIPAQK